MTDHGQIYPRYRPPRFHLTNCTTVVLKLQDGRQTRGELQIISRAGGLLNLSETLPNGSFLELELQTHLGTVGAEAEMLAPVTCSQQPFRFHSVTEGDQLRLQKAFESRLYRNVDEEEWIEELRAAAQNGDALRPRSLSTSILLGLLTLGTICAAVYALHGHLFLR